MFNFCRSAHVADVCDGQGRTEEAHPTDVLRSTDLRSGEDIRADEVPRRPREGATSVRARHVRKSGQGGCQISYYGLWTLQS